MTPKPSHLKINQDFQRPEFTAAQVRKLRDGDRRFYRRQVIWLVLYQVAVLGPCRYAMDIILNNPRFQWLSFVKPYIVFGMIIAVFLIWSIGLTVAFRRRT